MSSASSTDTWRTNTPRFFSRRTSPDSSNARNASRTGPRETPSSSAIIASLSLAPAGRSPARIIRSSSRWTSVGSEFDCNTRIVSAPWPLAATALAEGDRAGAFQTGAGVGVDFAGSRDDGFNTLRLDSPGCRLSTICMTNRHRGVTLIGNDFAYDAGRAQAPVSHRGQP